MGSKKSKPQVPPQSQGPTTNVINIKPPSSKTSKIIGIVIAVIILIVAIVGIFFLRRILVGDKEPIELSDRILYTYEGTIQSPGVNSTAGAVHDTLTFYFYTLNSGLMALMTDDGFYSIVPFTMRKSENNRMILTLSSYDNVSYVKDHDVPSTPDQANLMYLYSFNVYPPEYPSSDLESYVLEVIEVNDLFPIYQNFTFDNYVLLQQMVSFVSIIIGFIILFAFLVVVLGYLIFNQQSKARDITNVLSRIKEQSNYNLSGTLGPGDNINLYFNDDSWGWYEFTGQDNNSNYFIQLGQFIISNKQNETRLDMMRPTYYASRSNPNDIYRERTIPLSFDSMYLIFSINGTPKSSDPDGVSYSATLTDNRDQNLTGGLTQTQINFVKNK